MEKKTILLLDAGGTQALPAVEYFYNEKHRVVLFLYKKYTYGSGSRYAHEKVYAPDINNEKTYLKFLLGYLKVNKIDLIIPMSDVSAELISKHSKQLNKVSNVVTPLYESFLVGYNKSSLMKLCNDNDIPHPSTVHIDKLTDIEHVNRDMFPLFLKPNITTGGRGMGLVHSIQELRDKAPDIFKNFGSFHLQEFVPAGGNQFKVQLFRSENGKIIGSSVMHKVRFYPVDGGSSCYNKTIERNDLVNLCADVLDKLKWVGFADFDLIEDPQTNESKILEINPRLPACIKSAFKSGINYAEMYSVEAYNLEHQNYIYKPGAVLRHLGLDILWLLNSWGKPFHEKLTWFNFFAPNQSFQDLNFLDLKSFIYGTYGNVSR